MRRDLRNSHHLATISYDGRFWDAYLELVETQGRGQPARGRIAFSAADAGDAEPVRTTTIFIEDTPQEVVVRAREFKTHQLVALLRSAIPPDMETDPSGPVDASNGGATAGAEDVGPGDPGGNDAGGEAASGDQGEPAAGP
ncbi:MAG: hypothetical protein R6U63_06655 [Longimicrobiales bacterium]